MRQRLTDTRWTTGDIEAPMIQELGTQHPDTERTMKVAPVQKWTQVMRHEMASCAPGGAK